MFVSNEEAFLNLEANPQRLLWRPEHFLGLGGMSAHVAVSLRGLYDQGRVGLDESRAALWTTFCGDIAPRSSMYFVLQLSLGLAVGPRLMEAQSRCWVPGSVEMGIPPWLSAHGRERGGALSPGQGIACQGTHPTQSQGGFQWFLWVKGHYALFLLLDPNTNGCFSHIQRPLRRGFLGEKNQYYSELFFTFKHFYI